MLAREVHCADALEWLATKPDFAGCSFITSLPDVSELGGVGLEAWRAWFLGAATRVLERCPPEGVAIFFQTDVKKAGIWVDKGYLCQRAAEEAGAALLWHKVVCRKPPDTVTFGRPAYSHLLCFSRTLRADVSRSTPDVLSDAGEMPWARAMGVNACVAACRYVMESTDTRTVVDPFCGWGTALAVANALGMRAVGVEKNRKRAAKARLLEVSL